MDQLIVALEKFGLPVVMLGAVLWGIVKMFNWLANDLTVQIKKNEERIENIVIKLIDNSKKERELNRENFYSILNRMDALVDILVKLTGNGLGRKE